MLKEVREQRGMSLYRLAKNSEVSHSFLWEVEAGRKRLGLESAKKVAKALGCTIDILVNQK